MKALLLAVTAAVLAVPAMAEETAVPATATTYEQAFTECTDTTKDAQGDKNEALKACMTEKGFELKEDKTSSIDGLKFADAHSVTTTTATTATTATDAVVVETPVVEGAATTTTTVETPAADAAVTTTTEVTTEEEKLPEVK